MPTSVEKSRERVKKWKQENPEKLKEQKKNAIGKITQRPTMSE